jgi:hypothetical protein
MKAEKVGRSVGIGMRLAGKIFGSTLAGAGQSAGSVKEAVHETRMEAQRTRVEVAGKVARGAGRGVGGFIRPFARIGHILWLEVIGSIFLLFAIFFALNLWQLRMSYATGPDHPKFLLIAGLLVLFLYLGLSSFWRARRK